MRLRAFVAVGVLAGGAVSMTACGSASTTAGGSTPGSSSSGGSSGGASPGNGSSGVSSSSGSGETSSSSGSAGTGTSSSGGGSATSSGSGGGSGAGAGNDGGAGSSESSSSGSGEGDGSAPLACVKGQVKASEVVMLGDSYMDIGHVGPTIQMVAGATYRTYYLAGAALNYESGQLNIPYQFDSMAVPANPDIKVVITDGGGNDILINNSQCLSTPLMGDTSCHMIIDDVLSTAQKMLADMASKGVEHIAYYFYPHIDTTALFTGPDANDWLDYAYPMAAQACCAADALPAGTPDLTCHGSPAPGVDCVFIDTRPEFVGHNDPNDSSNYWFDSLGIHPNQQGADVLAQKVWGQMQKYCIAQ